MTAAAKNAQILVVDDEESMRVMLEIVLKNEGFSVVTASGTEEALEAISSGSPAVMIQDLCMPGMDGMVLLKRARALAPAMPVVVITAHSSWGNAVEAMRLGAFDYLRKPFDTDHIRRVVQRAVEVARNPGDVQTACRLIVGNTPAMQRVFDLIKLVAPTDSTVLLQGESGTGKELVARSLHASSHRARRQFVAVNCSAFHENLLESELFGHLRGAFTGAVDDRKGLFETASSGTLFLDEIAEMSLSTQVRILRVLEERRVTPLGGNSEVPVDVRIIAATHKDLSVAVKDGRFREDLYYRLNVIPLDLPPLRDRKDDIPLLAGHFLARHSKAMGKPVTSLSEEARRKLMSYDWPGNVRELENVIQRHVALCESTEIHDVRLGGARLIEQAAPPGPSASYELPPDGIVLDDVMDEIERKYL
ncbi:MAG: sigma-54 dependent transcriptional regulator, partial [Planctomycetes bacterium]|nr:sigma-54 dependent transcriptional regulator [Planctomycetota bacterium]